MKCRRCETVTFGLATALTAAFATGIYGDDQSLQRDLIVACHRLEVVKVINAIRAGADVNGRFGEGHDTVFLDKWTGGYPMSANKWTPLIALANASPNPDPPRQLSSTVEDYKWGETLKKQFSKEQLDRRQRDRMTILAVLLAHKCDIDAHDGYGATALYDAIHKKIPEEFAVMLVAFGANVNTKTRTYIDDAGNFTPLHRAWWSDGLTKLLLEKGADPKAKNGAGETPKDSAQRGQNAKVIELYGSQ